MAQDARKKKKKKKDGHTVVKLAPARPWPEPSAPGAYGEMPRQAR